MLESYTRGGREKVGNTALFGWPGGRIIYAAGGRTMRNTHEIKQETLCLALRKKRRGGIAREVASPAVWCSLEAVPVITVTP